MFIRLGYKINNIHNYLRFRKDNSLKFLVKRLPDKITPNQITLFRLVITLIWLPFAILHPSFWQIILFFIIYFFDLLDGAVARIKNKVTYFGEHFDLWADYVNHIILVILIMQLTFYKLVSLNFFIAWDLILSMVIVLEYFSKKQTLTKLRFLVNFCVRVSLWVMLIYEIAIMY